MYHSIPSIRLRVNPYRSLLTKPMRPQLTKLAGLSPNVTYILGSEGRSAKKSSGQIVGVEVD